ncbi:D-2-hydroxyacid dehydrogenase family protein [Pseudorhodobacter sp. W20_MBD10_FR17]|uniref:D-2-hydroxyacid dehydrogenase family protein n=1 Tax=Pseudorhodobacter sp. W20_MBD10_FR17 TaxID=3240266 RepID=UPI003F94ED45
MKIAVLDDYTNDALALADWSGLGDVTIYNDTLTDPAALQARLLPYEAICVMRERTPLPAALLQALPNLRLVVTTGPRNASIDLAAAKACGITLCGTESRKTTTSELAVLMMLALNRRLMPEVAGLNAGGWQTGLGRDLAGLRLGLVGLGNIGAQMAAFGRAFGMEVSAWSTNLTAAHCDDFGVTRADSLQDLMATSDVVSVHLVLSDRSRGLINAAAFAAMKPGAVFLNTSRAAIHDTAALLAGLHRGQPAMAGIDVFDAEPLPADDQIRDKGLIASGRLLLTPHLGYTTEATFRLFYEQTVEALHAFKSGIPIRVLA